jgi:hypothetical protein
MAIKHTQRAATPRPVHGASADEWMALEAENARLREMVRQLHEDIECIGDNNKAALDTAKAYRAENGQLRTENVRLRHLCETAWGIIANAGRDDWRGEKEFWQNAAARWYEAFRS